MKKKVVCVNYLNTIPLIRGLQQRPYSENFEIIPENPRVCSEKYIDGTADIALVPVATLVNDIKDYEIISDYCIASMGAVDTVGIFTNTELKNVQKVYLDDHSKTSQQLTKVILENYMSITPAYQVVDVSEVEIKANEAMLMIGDKAFGAKGKYRYFHDLGELWTAFTGLPFVYAVWISRANNPKIEKEFNEGVKSGLAQIPQIIAENKSLHPNIDLQSYYTKYIKYDFDKQKQEGLALFLDTLHVKSMPSLS